MVTLKNMSVTSKHLKESSQKNVWTDESKINLYQEGWWEKYGDMVEASGTRPAVFIDDVIEV